MKVRDLFLEQVRGEHEVWDPHAQEGDGGKRLIGEEEEFFLLRRKVRGGLDPVFTVNFLYHQRDGVGVPEEDWSRFRIMSLNKSEPYGCRRHDYL